LNGLYTGGAGSVDMEGHTGGEVHGGVQPAGQPVGKNSDGGSLTEETLARATDDGYYPIKTGGKQKVLAKGW